MIKRFLLTVAVSAVASTAFLVADANHPTGTRGLLLIDKLGGQIRFLDPVTYKERSAFEVATNPHDFALTADRKTQAEACALRLVPQSRRCDLAGFNRRERRAKPSRPVH
jgi:hypothetical protein